MPNYFHNYPFYVSLNDLTDKTKLIGRIKSISKYIAKMTKEEFGSLCRVIYNNIYVESKWNYNYFLMAEEINRHIENN